MAEDNRYQLCIKPEEFGGLTKAKITTTDALAQVFSETFRSIFTDFRGSAFVTNPYGALEFVMYFSYSDVSEPKKMKSVVKLVADHNDPNMRASQRLLNFDARHYSNRLLDLNKETKEMLEEFLYDSITRPTRNGNKKVNWRSLLTETSTANQYNQGDIFLKVTGIDYIKLLRAIYNPRRFDERKQKEVISRKYDYNISIIRPLACNYQKIVTNYLINVVQLDNNELAEASKTAGIQTYNMNIHMV